MGLDVADESLEPSSSILGSETDDPAATISISHRERRHFGDSAAEGVAAESNGHIAMSEVEMAASLTVPRAGQDGGGLVSSSLDNVGEEALLRLSAAESGPDDAVQEVSTLQVHTKKWSDFNTVSANTFGKQGGFGSFSDFLSDFPVDQAPLSGTELVSDTDFFEWHSGTFSSKESDSTLAESALAGSLQYLGHLSHAASQEGEHQPIPPGSEGQAGKGLPQTHFVQESQAQGIPDQQAQIGSELPEQQAHSGQGEVQENSNAYPGWFYDYQAFEWRQIEGNGGSAMSAAEGLIAHNVGEDGGSKTNVAQVGWAQSQQVEEPHGLPEQGAEQQVSWEHQFPGWYYDYHAQSWRQTAEHSESWGTGTAHQQLHGGEKTWYEQQAPWQHQSNCQSTYEGYRGDNVAGDRQIYEQHPNKWQGELDHTPLVPTSQSQVDRDQRWGMTPTARHQEPFMSQHQQSEAHENYTFNAQYSTYPQQPWGGSNSYQYGQFSYQMVTPPKTTFDAVKTSIGRPSHALVTFGFGGKLVIMKHNEPGTLHTNNYEQAWTPGPVQVQSLGVYMGSVQSWAGPLSGGAMSSKELNKWIAERVSMSPEQDSQQLLWGLLKVACQHYGKLRSLGGASAMSTQEEDGPEAALAKLLVTSREEQSPWTMGSLTSSHSLQAMTSEQQMQVTALEVKNLLMAGKRKDALKYALQGQLWGPALVLARQLGDKFYAEAVTEMAKRQFVPGSPLRTLSLLLAGQPAEVFVGPALPAKNVVPTSNAVGELTQGAVEGMLESWQENLAIMSANRTPGDERVILHLGDCLWRVCGKVAAAHICYLMADANLDSYSASARICLIGADHCKNPRTYATPEAIQCTEIYEYAKVLGNPQFILLPFQPYKVVYASMLAEAGKSAEALRYCQAVLKTLKTAGRSPDVDTCRQAASTLEDRLCMHTQDGHGLNLAPGKLVGRLLSSLDRGISRMIGGPPSPMLADTPGMENGVEHYASNSMRPGTSSGRSATPLVPSASMERLSKESNRFIMPPRSVSEPDFSRSPKQENAEGVNSGAGSPPTNAVRGRIGRFGSTFYQKALGFVSFTGGKKEAKLGDKNKFYYDEKLKRWVEEGVELPSEEATLPPPPTTSQFFGSRGDESHSVPTTVSKPGTPPVVPSSSNQFSSRARQQGVRSRYVDTFNKGGSSIPSKPALSSLVPVPRPGGGASVPAIFVPTPSLSDSTTEIGDTLANSATLRGNDESSSMEGYANLEAPELQKDVVRQQSSPPIFMAPPTSLPPVASADNGFAFSTVDANGFGLPTSSALGNGTHSRAASWGGYPSSFQNSHPESKEVTSYNLSNGYAGLGFSEASMKESSVVPPQPTNTELCKPSTSSDGAMDFSLLSLPTRAAPSTPVVCEGSGIAGKRVPLRNVLVPQYMASQAADSFVGEEMHEVEL